MCPCRCTPRHLSFLSWTLRPARAEASATVCLASVIHATDQEKAFPLSMLWKELTESAAIIGAAVATCKPCMSGRVPGWAQTQLSWLGARQY